MVFKFKRNLLLMGIIICLLVPVLVVKSFYFNKTSAPQPEGTHPNREQNEMVADKSEKSDFFATYRVERERIRGQQMEMLQNIIDDRNTEKAAREAASVRLMAITADMEKEMKAEYLVKSLGFLDCVVITQEGFTNVILQTDNLTEQQVKDIKSMLGQADAAKGDKFKITAINNA